MAAGPWNTGECHPHLSPTCETVPKPHVSHESAVPGLVLKAFQALNKPGTSPAGLTSTITQLELVKGCTFIT